MALHLYPNYKSLWYFTLGLCYTVLLCVVLMWYDDDKTESHGSSLAAEVPYLKRMFSYILRTTSDLKLSLDEYVTQVISLLRVNEVHNTSWALCTFLP